MADDLDPHAAVAALEAIGDELGEPFAEHAITGAITNPAPIEHELVMDEWSAMTMQSRLRCLARNLRDAAGCALGWRLHRDFELNWKHGDCEAWCPNLDGKPAPGWEP